MSHFTVLVIGNNPEKQLARYKENIENLPKEWLEFEDSEKEYLEEWEKNEKTHQDWYPSDYVQINKEDWEKLKEDGELKLENFNEILRIPVKDNIWSLSYKEETDCPRKEIFAKIINNIVPKNEKGYSIQFKMIDPPIKTKIKDAYKTFDKFVKKYHCEEKRDPEKGRYGYWANPKAKWDWYQLGGRWTGYFKLKKYENTSAVKLSELTALAKKHNLSVSEVKDLILAYEKGYGEWENIIKEKYKIRGFVGTYGLQSEIEELIKPKYENAKVGHTGCMGDMAKDGWVDQAYKRDIDFEGMEEKSRKESKERYETVEEVFGGKIPKLTYSWKDLTTKKEFKEWSIDKKRDMYWNQPAMKMLEEVKNKSNLLNKKDRDLITWLDLESYQVTKKEYINSCGDSSFVSFAVVKDGKWYEKGEMGWWGCVHNEKNIDEWIKEFNKMLKEIPNDTLLSVFDCHI